MSRLFDQVADLIVQFGGSPEGAAFIAAYRASSQIIDRGHGPSPQDTAATTPAPAPPEAGGNGKKPHSQKGVIAQARQGKARQGKARQGKVRSGP